LFEALDLFSLARTDFGDMGLGKYFRRNTYLGVVEI